MTKKNTLSQALAKAAKPTQVKIETIIEEKNDEKLITKPAARKGTKLIAGHFDPAVSRQIKQIALDREITVQEVLREALNDIFVKNNKSPIA